MQVFDPQAFKERRKAAGYTQKVLGEAIGTVESHVQYWERGAKQPTATYLLRAMVLMKCAPSDLLKDE